MSVIRKKPFIEDLIEDLSDEQKSDLLDVMNGAGNTVDASFTNMPADAISSVLFKLENNNLKTGILVQSENYNVLLAYHRFQDMQMFKLDTDKFTFEKVNEYLDINELRRVLAAGNEAGEGGAGSSGASIDKVSLGFNFYSDPLSIDFFFPAGELVKDKATVNEGISNINTSFGVNIPLFENLNSLSSILDYVNANISNDTVYDAIFAGLFSWFSSHLINARMFVDGAAALNVDIAGINLEQNYYTLTANEEATLTVDGTSYNYQNPWHIASSNDHTKYTSVFVESFGSGSGGTVEAEPIISIKMTNVDAKQFDEDEEKLRDAQFYCTKERWDNFVALASQQFQIDITYQNFDSVFKQFNLQTQTFALGYLLMDYNDGKILPTSYLANKDVGLNDAAIYYFYKGCVTMKNSATGNIEVVMSASFDNDEAFPNAADRNNVPYTTANTVITVEEIDGPAIGASSGSGTSDVLYKHTISGLVDTNQLGTYTISFLSKYNQAFANSESLSDFLTNMQATQDDQVMISPQIILTRSETTYNPVIVNGYEVNLVTNGLDISVVGDSIEFLFADNTSITDVVEPYIQVSGGSGSSVDLSNLQVGHLTFSNSKTTGIKSVGSIWSVLSLEFETQYESYKFWAKYMCSEEEMYDLMNEQLEQYRQQGLTIPTVTDHDTLTQAFNTIIDTLFALDSSGAALNIAGLITLMFGPSVYGPFQGFMKDSGTTLFSLIRSGDDFGMCILDAQGQRVDVLQTLVSDIGTTKPTNISVWIND